MPYGQPTRSAITVAGIVGTALNNSRIRGSNPSTRDPAGARSYLGGPSLANAAFTVFREQPTTRAISETETPSDRRNLRISEHGAKRLVGSVLTKLSCSNRTLAVAIALREGLLDLASVPAVGLS